MMIINYEFNWNKFKNNINKIYSVSKKKKKKKKEFKKPQEKYYYALCFH